MGGSTVDELKDRMSLRESLQWDEWFKKKDKAAAIERSQ